MLLTISSGRPVETCGLPKLPFPRIPRIRVRVAGETEEGARPRVRPTHAAFVLVASGLAAIVYTYPLVIHFGEAIPYGLGVSPERRVQGLVPGDQLQFLYFLSVTDD